VSAGIEATAAQESGQLEVRDWTEMHLGGGRFDQDKTLALFEGVVKQAKRQGFPRIRFVTHMEWALKDLPGVGDLLE
jgi:hypothetical protein